MVTVAGVDGVEVEAGMREVQAAPWRIARVGVLGKSANGDGPDGLGTVLAHTLPAPGHRPHGSRHAGTTPTLAA